MLSLSRIVLLLLLGLWTSVTKGWEPRVSRRRDLGVRKPVDSQQSRPRPDGEGDAKRCRSSRHCGLGDLRDHLTCASLLPLSPVPHLLPLQFFEDQIHVFQMFAEVSGAAEVALDEAGAFIRDKLRQQQPLSFDPFVGSASAPSEH